MIKGIPEFAPPIVEMSVGQTGFISSDDIYFCEKNAYIHLFDTLIYKESKEDHNIPIKRIGIGTDENDFEILLEVNGEKIPCYFEPIDGRFESEEILENLDEYIIFRDYNQAEINEETDLNTLSTSDLENARIKAEDEQKFEFAAKIFKVIQGRDKSLKNTPKS